MSDPLSVVSRQSRGSLTLALASGLDAIDRSIGDEPVWVQIAHDGLNESVNGNFVINDEGYALIEEAFAKKRRPIVFDYDHQSLGGAYAAPDGKAPAAGWITKLRRDKGRGVFALVEWTVRAREMIRAGEYRYPSPVLIIRIKDRVAVALAHAALTNNPAIDGIQMLAASESFLQKEFGTMPDHEGTGNGTGEQGTGTPDLGILLGEIKSMLGIDLDSAEPLAIVTAIRDTLKAKKPDDESKGDGDEGGADSETVANMRKALGLSEGADGAALVVAVNTLKQGGGSTAAMQVQINALKKSAADRDATDLLQPYLSCGALSSEDEKTLGIFADMARTDPENCKILLEQRKDMLVMSGETIAPPKSVTARSDEEELIANSVKAHDGNYKEGLVALQKKLIGDECERTGFSRDRVVKVLTETHPKIFG